MTNTIIINGESKNITLNIGDFIGLEGKIFNVKAIETDGIILAVVKEDGVVANGKGRKFSFEKMSNAIVLTVKKTVVEFTVASLKAVEKYSAKPEKIEDDSEGITDVYSAKSKLKVRRELKKLMEKYSKFGFVKRNFDKKYSGIATVDTDGKKAGVTRIDTNEVWFFVKL